jgi:hypothetical protein
MARPQLGGALVGVLFFFSSTAIAQQAVDPAFAPRIETPEYEAGHGPRVVIDAAHLNHDTADGSYLPFAELLRRDRYTVESNLEAFTLEGLDRVDVLVIVNAMHEQSETDWAPLPSLAAFTEAEVAVLEQWVREGGSVLLIADHMPLPGHAESLAAAFGVRFYNGFAYDAARNPHTTFRRSDGSLAQSVVTDGRGPDEHVEFVTTFTGQAFRLDPMIKRNISRCPCAVHAAQKLMPCPTLNSAPYSSTDPSVTTAVPTGGASERTTRSPSM